MISNNSNTNLNLDKLITDAGKDKIEGFNGEIYEYDINYRDVAGSAYVNGTKTDSNVNLTSGKAGDFKKKEPSLAVNALRTNEYVDWDIDPNFPWWLDETCTIYYTVVRYYTNGRLTGIYLQFDGYTCPPVAPEPGGSGSGSGSGSASLSQAQNEDPPYGGGSGSTPPPSIVDASATRDCVKDVINTIKANSTGKINVDTLFDASTKAMLALLSMTPIIKFLSKKVP